MDIPKIIRKVGFTLNPDDSIVNALLQSIAEDNCKCISPGNEHNKCPCDAYLKEGKCYCGLYLKVKHG